MDFDFTDTQEKMEKALEACKKEMATIRTGRANPEMLNHIKVESYGAFMPINQVATVSVPESRTLSLQIWDKGMVSPIEKAILNSNLGLTPVYDGNLMRVTLPELTEDRRRELSKVVAKYAESARISVRNIRRDALEKTKKLEKDGGCSKDDLHRFTAQIQKMTDETIEKVDEALSSKSKELTTL